jgi:hypothetical protein
MRKISETARHRIFGSVWPLLLLAACVSPQGSVTPTEEPQLPAIGSTADGLATDQATRPPSPTVAEMATRTPEATRTTNNTPPVALEESYTTAEDASLVVGPPGVLGNDTDADGDPLTADTFGGASPGTLTLNSDGSFTFKPRVNFNGVASFHYQARDSSGAGSNLVRVLVTVTPVDDPCAAADPIRVKFQPGEVEATLDFSVGETRRIVLYAFAGQILRVSVDPEPDFLRICGEDGTELEEGYGSFWRGSLPSTQDYFIEMVNEYPGDDSIGRPLRVSVVVVPRGETTTWLDYRDEANGFTLRYPDLFAVVERLDRYPFSPGEALIFTGSEYFQNTNLNYVSLFVSRWPEAEAIAGCTDLDYPPRIGPVDQLQIDSVTFTRAHQFDQDIGGKRAHVFIHRTVHDDACWGITFVIDYTDRLFFDQPITEFDYDGILNHLRSVLATFEFIQG